jgi:threonine/homoserine/homoserine lactone efflux protein
LVIIPTPEKKLMEFFLFIISAFMMGFIAAVPVGPIQIEVMRRSINGHLKSSLMVILGAFLSDIIYGVIAFFGIAPFLKERMVMAVFWLGGALILIALGIMTVKNSLRPREFNHHSKHLKKKRWAFLGGLSLSGTNPMMVLWWLLGARLFSDVGLIHDFTQEVAASFLIAGSLGLACYLATLSLVLYWAKRFISERKIMHINLGFGIVLLCIAGYFIFSSLQYFFQPR